MRDLLLFILPAGGFSMFYRRRRFFRRSFVGRRRFPAARRGRRYLF